MNMNKKTEKLEFFKENIDSKNLKGAVMGEITENQDGQKKAKNFSGKNFNSLNHYKFFMR
jgi:hypothetical protein